MKTVDFKRVFWPVVMTASLIAAGISLAIGLRQSVWFDEAYSIALAEHSWSNIVRLTAQDVHPPLYYWLLKAWMMLFGSGELALRSMSALLLGLSVGLTALLLRRLFGAKNALVALPFLVLAPFLLRYGFEIRMYTLASLIGIAATYVLLAACEMTDARRRHWLFAGYAGLVAAGVYTMYFMALVWLAHLAWLSWLVLRERQHWFIVPAVASYAASFLLFVPWLPVFLSKAGGGTLSPVTGQLGLENAYGMLTFLFLYQPSWNTQPFTLMAIGAIIASVAYLSWQAIKRATIDQRRGLGLLGVYVAVPILVLIVVTHIMPVYLERYLAHFAIGSYAYLGVIVTLGVQRRNYWSWLAAGVLIMTLLIGCVNLTRYGNYNFQRIHTPSVKQASALLDECHSGAIIFADGPQLAVELGYYVKDCPVYFFNETLKMSGGFAMLSGSPFRVASSAELPKADTILHIYDKKPKNTLPLTYKKANTHRIDKVTVDEYSKYY
jgi:mannosyltransferase